MKIKFTLIFPLILIFSNIISSQNEEDIQTLSIFSEYVKSKNYDSAYSPWMELRSRNPRFNKAIFIYGERILNHKIKSTSDQDKISYINDMLKLWEQRKNYFPSSTPLGTYAAKACQLKYDYRNELGLTKDDLLDCFSNSYELDSKTFTNPKSLYTYFSLVVDMYDLKKISAKDLFNMYDLITEKVESELKNYTNKRNSFLGENGEPKSLSRKETSRLSSYNSYLRAYEKISSSIDTKLGSRANCENLIPLYQKDFDNFKNDGIWLQRAMNRMYSKGCNNDPLFVSIVEQKNKLEPNADTSFYLALLKEKAGLREEALCFIIKRLNLRLIILQKPKYFLKLPQALKIWDDLVKQEAIT